MDICFLAVNTSEHWQGAWQSTATLTTIHNKESVRCVFSACVACTLFVSMSLSNVCQAMAAGEACIANRVCYLDMCIHSPSTRGTSKCSRAALRILTQPLLWLYAQLTTC